MAAKKPASNRLGSDPLSWIRDTRDDEEEAVLEQPQAAPEPQKPAQPEPVATPEPRIVEKPPQTAPVAVVAPQAVNPAQAEEDAPEEAKTPDSGEAAELPATAAAISPEQLEALAQLLGMAKAPGKRGRPRTNFREVTKSSQEGLPENWTRATFIVRETYLETLKDYAYTQRMTIRDVLDEALALFLADKEVIERKGGR